jgi:hypothetical protein
VLAAARALLPPLIAIVTREGQNHVLSYEADRALVHWLGLKGRGGGSASAGLLQGADAETARFAAGDYARKTLRRRAEEEESDDEAAE